MLQDYAWEDDVRGSVASAEYEVLSSLPVLYCALCVVQDYAWRDYVRGKDLQKYLASQQELLDRFTRQQGPGVSKVERTCWRRPWVGEGCCAAVVCAEVFNTLSVQESSGQKYLASQQELLDRFARQQGPGVLRVHAGIVEQCRGQRPELRGGMEGSRVKFILCC
jgi:hypothetical protein